MLVKKIDVRIPEVSGKLFVMARDEFGSRYVFIKRYGSKKIYRIKIDKYLELLE